LNKGAARDDSTVLRLRSAARPDERRPLCVRESILPAEPSRPGRSVSAGVRLAAEDLELLADLVAQRVLERLDPTTSVPSVTLDAAAIARRYGVTAAWVREHADRLGAMRLGDGPRPRLRFDVERVAAAMASGQVNRRPDEPESGAAPSSSRRRRRRRTGTGVELLPIRGAGGPAGVESGRPIKSGPGAAGTARGLAPEGQAPARHARYPARAAERSSHGAAPSALRPEGADMAPTTRAIRGRARAS
jgi:hypothetical protein